MRSRARRSLGVPWYPMVCFGTLTMLSAPLVAAWGLGVMGPVWLVGGTAGMLLTRRHYRRRALDSGVTGRGRRAWAIAVSMFVLCLLAGFAAGGLSGRQAGVIAPIVVVAAGYLTFGWLQRSWLLPLAVAPAAVAAIALVLLGVAAWTVELSFGAGLVLAGVATRAAGERA